MPTLATILMLQAGLHSFVLAIVSSLRLCSCSRVNQAYLLLGPNIIGQQVIYYNRAARLEYSWLSFKELRWSNLPNHNFTHYMAELVIRSIRKTIHSDWLPSRAISFSYRPEIGVDLKTNKPYSRRFYKRFTEKKSSLLTWFVQSVVHRIVFALGFFSTQTSLLICSVSTKTPSKQLPVQTSHPVNK